MFEERSKFWLTLTSLGGTQWEEPRTLSRGRGPAPSPEVTENIHKWCRSLASASFLFTSLTTADYFDCTHLRARATLCVLWSISGREDSPLYQRATLAGPKTKRTANNIDQNFYYISVAETFLQHSRDQKMSPRRLSKTYVIALSDWKAQKTGCILWVHVFHPYVHTSFSLVKLLAFKLYIT